MVTKTTDINNKHKSTKAVPDSIIRTITNDKITAPELKKKVL